MAPSGPVAHAVEPFEPIALPGSSRTNGACLTVLLFVTPATSRCVAIPRTWCWALSSRTTVTRLNVVGTFEALSTHCLDSAKRMSQRSADCSSGSVLNAR